MISVINFFTIHVQTVVVTACTEPGMYRRAKEHRILIFYQQ